MKRYILDKITYDLTDEKVCDYLKRKYQKYYSQRIEGLSSCVMYFKGNLVFAKRIDNKMLLVSVLAPAPCVEHYWCTFPIHQLSRRIFDLFYKRKYILL